VSHKQVTCNLYSLSQKRETTPRFRAMHILRSRGKARLTVDRTCSTKRLKSSISKSVRVKHKHATHHEHAYVSSAFQTQAPQARFFFQSEKDA